MAGVGSESQKLTLKSQGLNRCRKMKKGSTAPYDGKGESPRSPTKEVKLTGGADRSSIQSPKQKNPSGYGQAPNSPMESSLLGPLTVQVTDLAVPECRNPRRNP